MRRTHRISYCILTACLLGVTSQADSIPKLDPKGKVYKTEGPTDLVLHAKAIGKLKAIMVFVDFPDVPGTGKTADVADHLLGGGKAQQWFKDSSYGKMQLAVTQVPGWRRMSKSPAEYPGEDGVFHQFEPHKVYIAEACALFPEVDFSDYDFVYVVAARDKGIFLSPAFNAYPGNGIKSGKGEARLVVTFGWDSYKNRYTNLIHETGHLLGLPDLYHYGKDGVTPFGGWDIMCDLFKATSFIGWHRHKLGWLDDERKIYHKKGKLRTTITPLSSSKGKSMIVVPCKGDDRGSKVYVVEIAEPILGSNGKLHGDGVLVYSIDARNPSGKYPATVYPCEPGNSPVYGKMYKAPFGKGTTFDKPDAPMTVKVLSKHGRNYRVEVTVK